MKWRGALGALIGLTLLYVAALVWIDARHRVFDELPRLLSSLPFVVVLSFCSYLVRYARWLWLLRRIGYRFPVVKGFLAYLSGFAFTATPGKVGELVRIRYFASDGVPASEVLAAFIYERAFDLLVVLLLASLAVRRADLFASVVAFVAIFIAIVVVAANRAPWFTRIADALDARGWRLPARIVVTLRDGLVRGRVWFTPADIVVSALLGIVSWTITAYSFVWLISHLAISIPFVPAMALYPLALLAGAASMLPGGIGSTEVAIIALLGFFGVPLDQAALAAIGIRLASLWFAVACGFIAIGLLEWRALGERNVASSAAADRLTAPSDARSLPASDVPTRPR